MLSICCLHHFHSWMLINCKDTHSHNNADVIKLGKLQFSVSMTFLETRDWGGHSDQNVRWLSLEQLEIVVEQTQRTEHLWAVNRWLQNIEVRHECQIKQCHNHYTLSAPAIVFWFIFAALRGRMWDIRMPPRANWRPQLRIEQFNSFCDETWDPGPGHRLDWAAVS